MALSFFGFKRTLNNVVGTRALGRRRTPWKVDGEDTACAVRGVGCGRSADNLVVSRANSCHVDDTHGTVGLRAIR